jgi:molybdopterin-guanine dinucleotide biosynthesis protein A
LELLPVSGFVLAGGKGSRMAADKALVQLHGRPLVELAVEKLSNFCADVAISGNRDDLARFAPVVTETRLDAGPGAGVEAGLRSARHDWCLFIPVDVPLLPVELLRSWVVEVLEVEFDDLPKGSFLRGSYLLANKQPQPSICMLHRDCLKVVAKELDRGERRLRHLLEAIEPEFGAGSLWVRNAAGHSPKPDPAPGDLDRWFLNVNTPEELIEAEESGSFSA